MFFSFHDWSEYHQRQATLGIQTFRPGPIYLHLIPKRRWFTPDRILFDHIHKWAAFSKQSYERSRKRSRSPRSPSNDVKWNVFTQVFVVIKKEALRKRRGLSLSQSLHCEEEERFHTACLRRPDSQHFSLHWDSFPFHTCHLRPWSARLCLP